MYRTRRRQVLVVLVALLVATGGVPLAALGDTEDANDTRDGADPIASGSEVTGSLEQGDVDWYRFTVTRGEAIEVTATDTSASDGGYTVFITDERGFSLTNGRPLAGGSTVIGLTAERTGTYYLSVERGVGAYEVGLRTFATDDPEPNEGLADATPYTPGETRSGRLTAGDDDWYSFTAIEGQALEITASRPSTDPGQFLIWFVREDGSLTSTNVRVSAGEVERIGTTILRNGTYYVLVEELNGDRGNYTFTVTTEFTDPFEPNQDRATATQLFENPRGPIEATIHTSDTDTFAVTAEAGSTIDATLARPSTGSGLLFVRVTDAVGRSLASSLVTSVSATQATTATVDEAGTYYLIVTPVTSSTGNYSLAAEVDGEAVGLPNDRFELNEAIPTAAAIEPGRYDDLAIVDDDVDTFALVVGDDERVDASIAFAHADNDLTLELLDAAGTVLATGDSDTDGEAVSAVVPEAGTYYLRATGQPGAVGIYSLSIARLGAVTLSVGPGVSGGTDVLAPGGTATYDVAVLGLGDGATVGSLDIVVTTSNASAVNVTTAALAGPGTVTVAPDGSSVRLNGSVPAPDGAPTSITVATVTVGAVAPGNASVAVAEGATVRTSDGRAYPIDERRGVAVSVAGGGDGTGTEVSVALAPTDRTVGIDGTATYDVVVTGIDAGVGSYSLSVRSGDTTLARVAGIDDAIGGTPRSRATDDGTGIRAGSFAGDTAQSGSVTIATVTVEGVAAGAVDLSLSVDSLSDEGGARYDVVSATGADLTVTEVVAPDVTGNGLAATDPDGDGLYEDVNGDGVAAPGDATVLFNAVFDGNPAVTEHVALFDFNGDGSVTPGDATVLFDEIFG